MAESIKVWDVIPAAPERIFKAWLSSQEHSAFTGGEAEIDPNIGGQFTAWDGYIRGKTIATEPYLMILQTWRTTEFPEGSPDSRLQVLLEEVDGGAKVTLVQTSIPDGQGKQYEEGWREYYFKPMKVYFGSPGDKGSR